MATEQEVIDVVLKPLLSLYRPPAHWSDEETLLAAKQNYIAALTPFKVKALQQAKAAVVAKHNGWEMPPPSAIVREAYNAS